MFEENENLVTDVTENVEQTTEEIAEDVQEETQEQEEAVETFTKEQVDEMIAKKLARKEAKIRKEYADKYSRLETVVNTGLGTSTVEEATTKLTDFYKKKGVSIPDTPSYSERDMQILANAEALDIIDSGYDEIVEEVDRLAEIGLDNMSAKDKIIFHKLANERQRIEDEKSLATIGVSKDVLNDEAFKEFSKKLAPNLSLKEKYEMYSKLNPRKKYEQIGSMTGGQQSKVKDFYSAEEIEMLTEEDLDDPAVWEAVRKSMTGRA